MRHPISIAALFLVLMAAAGTGCSTVESPASPTAPAAPAPPPAAPPPEPAPAPEPEPPAPPPGPQPTATARYRVTFDATWSAATHPTDAPGNPHFSPLIGGTHAESVTFWREGGLATEGIERMAELGLPTTLADEIRAAVAAGTAQHLIEGPGLDSPGTVAVEFDATVQFPLVTLVTMVAPSPDWFVGVSGLSLLQNGDWAAEISVPLVPWDAGTDDGASFESPDADANPKQPIRLITTPPLAVNGEAAPMGTFTFRRIDQPAPAGLSNR